MHNILTLAQVPTLALTLRNDTNGIKVLVALLSLSNRGVHQTALLLAAGILAFPGTPKPVGHAQFKLAMQLLEQLHLDTEINRKLRKSAKGICADYDITRPSNLARQQDVAQRKKDGKTYIGPRMVGTKQKLNGVNRLIVSSAQARCQRV